MAGYRVGFAPRALADVQRIAKWWRANRDGSPQLFRTELDLALVMIAAHPEVGKRGQLRAHPNARTFLLHRSSYVVVYSIHEAEGILAIARVRHMHRRPLARKREH